MPSVKSNLFFVTVKIRNGLWNECYELLRNYTLDNFDYYCITKETGGKGVQGSHFHAVVQGPSKGPRLPYDLKQSYKNVIKLQGDADTHGYDVRSLKNEMRKMYYIGYCHKEFGVTDCNYPVKEVDTGIAHYNNTKKCPKNFRLTRTILTQKTWGDAVIDWRLRNPEIKSTFEALSDMMSTGNYEFSFMTPYERTILIDHFFSSDTNLLGKRKRVDANFFESSFTFRYRPNL